MTELRYVGVKNRTLRDLARLYLASARGGRQRRAEFDGVRTFCMFVRYPRSGHSLVAAAATLLALCVLGSYRVAYGSLAELDSWGPVEPAAKNVKKIA